MTQKFTTACLFLSMALTVCARPSLAENTAGQRGKLTIEVNAAASNDGFVDISLLNSNEQFSGQMGATAKLSPDHSTAKSTLHF